MRLLVSTNEGLGNVILTTPTIRALSMLGHEVDMGLGHKAHAWKPVFEHWSEIGHVFIENGETGLVGADIRKYDAVVRTIWGKLRPPGMTILNPSHLIGLTNAHEAQVSFTIAEKLGYRGPMPHPYCGYDAGELERPYVVFLTACKPGREWDQKRTPDTFWPKLAEWLVPEAVFLGAAGDSRPWMKECGIDLCGAVSLRRAIGIIKEADVAVGIDCGLAHAAAAVGTPLVVMFGPSLIRKNRPLGPDVRVLSRGLNCSPCQYQKGWSECQAHHCMDFAPEEVVEAVKEEL